MSNLFSINVYTFFFFPRWGYPKWLVIVGGSFFLIIDVAFFSANTLKIPNGGWVPIGIGALLMLVMCVWVYGRFKEKRIWTDESTYFHLMGELSAHITMLILGVVAYQPEAPLLLPSK